MDRFEPRTSGFGSDPSTNWWATTTALDKNTVQQVPETYFNVFIATFSSEQSFIQKNVINWNDHADGREGKNILLITKQKRGDVHGKVKKILWISNCSSCDLFYLAYVG